MENRQHPFSSSFGQNDQYNTNVNGLPLVSGQNSQGIRGTERGLDDNTNLPMVDAALPAENAVQQPAAYDPNADDVAPNSPPITAESFTLDSSADMSNIIDQIMGRGLPDAFSFSGSSGFQTDAYTNAATPALFVPPQPNTTFMNSLPTIGNFQTVMDNQTQTAPLYNAAQAQATVSGINNRGQSASFSSNYYFPVNDVIQQPSMYASNPLPNWQGTALGNQGTALGNQGTALGNQGTALGNPGTALGNQGTALGSQFGQYSAPPTMFNPQAYNSFSQDASTALFRPQQPSPGNQFMNVNPGTSLPVMSQFSSPNINSVMPSTSLPMMSHYNSLNTSPRMPETSLPGSVAFNPMNASPIMPGTYTLPVTVSASNATPVASFGNPGRIATFGPGMSAQLGYNTFTSGAPHLTPSGSSAGGASMGANSRGTGNQISGASSAGAGREIMRQDVSGTLASVVTSSQQGSSSRQLETYQQMMQDAPIFNKVYDPRYAELGLPVDPYLRMFNQHPEFWQKSNDLSKK